ncbi:hypothetical protein ABT275_33105, partial [Streptomyces sp. NPDC001185]|uniref:hypothetical protein n=1 Tax=Streptomyces sp. NPDC001185 TaxID=3154380 RepID=UPI00332433B1
QDGRRAADAAGGAGDECGASGEGGTTASPRRSLCPLPRSLSTTAPARAGELDRSDRVEAEASLSAAADGAERSRVQLWLGHNE